MLISREQIGFQKLTKAAWLSLVYSTGRGDPGRIVNTGSPFLQFTDQNFIQFAGFNFLKLMVNPHSLLHAS